MYAKGEVLLTIMASLAQQESQSMSQNIKLGLQYRYQQGHVQVNHNHFLGYTKDSDSNLVIDPEQAETVKRIYREYMEGYSMDKIAAGLMADGILTGAGKTKWWTSTINEMVLDKSGYMKMLQENIATVIRNDASASTDDIDAKLLELQKELLQKANNRDDYDSIADEIFQLRELKAKSETDSIVRDERLARITKLCDFLKEQPSGITTFDEILVRRLLQKITVFDDHFKVEFKSGVSVDIEG